MDWTNVEIDWKQVRSMASPGPGGLGRDHEGTIGGSRGRLLAQVRARFGLPEGAASPPPPPRPLT